MKDIESKISPLIAGLFPSFYGEDGPNFIAFVKAYYEWLEQNFQLLDLEDVTDFKVGDTVQQAEVTGTIFSIDTNSVLVHVDGLDTFKCFNVCSELIPVTSSSGGSTFILKGGTTRRLGTIFLGRNLGKLRDIDKTIDLFVVKFKEKYLKNIEFDTMSNKRLLVKNSLDLYRSKGTARSIDLFFRLIYGTKSTVYFPGDDLFRLSDAEWFKPQYIEINSTSIERAISLVGKQVVGIRSGATAFVERYVKKKVNTGHAHVFYVSSVSGTFEVGESLRYNQIFSDSPIVLGSFTEATVLEGSELFNVGDFVDFESDTGLGAVARVTQTIKGTGEVSFTVANNGWGYATNRNIDTDPVTSNTLLSEKTLLLSNVTAGIQLSSITPAGGGAGYDNTDIIVIQSQYREGKAAPTTNSSGSIVSIRILDRGFGFTGDPNLDALTFKNSAGGDSAGDGVSQPIISYGYPDNYFQFLETVTQPIHNITYTSAVGIEQINMGMQIEVGTGANNFGTIIDINKTSNNITISLFNNSTINTGAQLKTVSNASNYVIADTVNLQEAQGQVVRVIPTGTIGIEPRENVYAVNDVIYQQDEGNNIIASATITDTSQLASQGVASVSNITGVFRTFANKLLIANKPEAVSNCSSVSFSIALDTANTFVDNFAPFVYSSSTGTTATVSSTTAGRDADFRITTLENIDIVRVNTDRLSNNITLNTKLNANTYNLPYNQSANSSAILYGALAFEGVTIGSINTLGNISPGTGYNRNPYAVAYQPYVLGNRARDYIFTISNSQTNFNVGEIVTQNNIINTAKLFVANTLQYRVGELVHVANSTTNFIANGVVQYANTVNNYVAIEGTVGNFPVPLTGYTLNSLISTANSTISSAVSNTAVVVARGIVKENIGNKLYVKRIQLKDNFTANTITGTLSDTIALITVIEKDTDSQPAGLNANILTKASTADGVVSRVQITDSGFGFSNDSDLVFRSQTDDRAGIVSSVRGGVGTSTGYYRSAKGFISDISCIHDGDYYQEYSYDIISRIPLDKYSSMFKKVMHTAGTRYFGTVLIESLATVETNVTYANTFIEITTDSPYTIEDRESLDIQDINDFNIEIRE